MNDLNSDSVRRTAAWLGYGGLIPFVVLAPASLLDPIHGLSWSDALFGYGAVILSFVGALHWAFAMTASGLDEQQRVRSLIWSVVPALIAWPALLLMPAFAAVLLVGGFAVHYLVDRNLTRRANLPAWYLPLRLRLTVVGSLSLVAGAFVTV